MHYYSVVEDQSTPEVVVAAALVASAVQAVVRKFLYSHVKKKNIIEEGKGRKLASVPGRKTERILRWLW